MIQLYANIAAPLVGRSPAAAPFIIRSYSNPNPAPRYHAGKHVWGSHEQLSHQTRPYDTFFHNFDDPAKFIAKKYDKILAHQLKVIAGGDANVLNLAASPGMTHIDKIINGAGTVSTREVAIVFEKDTGDVKTIYPKERN